MLAHSQDMIINTYNYYTWNPNLSDIETYEKLNPESKWNNWAQVTNGMTQEKAIINAARFEIFDYSIFEYFDRYKEFVPNERMDLMEKEVLLKNDDLNPTHVSEFLIYLEKFLESEFPNQEYYYAIYDKQDQNLNLNPARVSINGVVHNVSTIHTTYSKEEFITNIEEHIRYKDCVQIRKEEGTNRDDWLVSWQAINNDTELKTDNKTLVFKKVLFGDILSRRFIELQKLCEIATKLNLKIKRNTDWFG